MSDERLVTRHALTIWAEWAFAICRLGKRVENRTWEPPKFLVGKRFAIHAGAHVGGRKAKVARREGMQRLAEVALLEGRKLAYSDDEKPIVAVASVSSAPALRECPMTYRIATGAIVATARLSKVVTGPGALEGPGSGWYMGPVGWCLDEVKVFQRPIAVKGAQGLWLIRNNLLDRVTRAEESA